MNASSTMDRPSLRQRLISYFDDHADDILAAQNADGSFGRQRLMNDQYAFYPLALLHQIPRSRYFQSAAFLQAAVRGMDRLEQITDDQGRIEFIGQNGFSWGYTLHDWSTFYWQETLVLLSAVLDPAWRDRHIARLQETLGFHLDDARARWKAQGEHFGADVHNLFIWKALLLYRGGRLWDRAEWRDMGETFLQQAVAAQHEEGWWSEGGPGTTYNLVTTHAISLYREFSGDLAALKAVERALDYHISFSYPDGRPIETVDGRTRYHHNVSMQLPVGFARFERGKAFVGRIIQRLPAALENFQGITMMGSCLAHLDDETTESTASESDVTVRVFSGTRAGVLRRDGFCVSLCGFETIPTPSGFRLDRQNLLSVWHERTGLIVGGGHSKLQPAFSCFNITDRNGRLFYLHHEPTVSVNDGGLCLTMRYGEVPVRLEARVIEAGRIQLLFACDGMDAQFNEKWYVQAQLIFHAAIGRSLSGEHCRQVLDERSIWWSREDFGRRLRHNGWELLLPEAHNANVQWPVRPHNSYRADRKSPLSEAAFVLNIPLTPDLPVATCEIRVDGM